MSNLAEGSNIRWEWERLSPSHWELQIKSPARFFYDTVAIVLPRANDWMLYINGKYIATFPSWDEASQAAPMLYQLHKDSK